MGHGLERIVFVQMEGEESERGKPLVLQTPSSCVTTHPVVAHLSVCAHCGCHNSEREVVGVDNLSLLFALRLLFLEARLDRTQSMT